MNAVFDKANQPISGIIRLKTVKEYLSLREKLSDFSGVAKIKALKQARELLNLLGYGVVQKAVSGSLKAADLYAFDDTKTKTQRQRDNNAVFELLDKVERGELQPENLTAADKMTLAKYSGSGGGLKSRDGKTGSAHEYYTPAPVAQAMWKAIEEMGFSGGKVLDPCGGSGIFGAFAPETAIVQAVEMDETSATVNKLVNGSERYHVDIASFEERANDIPDNSVDAIVTNVPFGDVSLRKHRNKDSKFRKENLQTYFVLRSLDKLRHGGLAAFIVPSSFLDGKGGKAVNARVLTSQIAEFIGAYRLPNSVFGTAAADVATDVIFYRKYSADVIEKITELQAQNPDILSQANVMWDVYTGGQYFRQPENKKFIFGEESEVESWRTDKDGNKQKVYAVINNDSVANIAQAIKKFSDSRIDWALLETTETEPQTYNQGDTVYQNGQAYVFDGVKFNAVEVSHNEAESRANDIMAKLDTPLSAFEHKLTAKDIQAACEYYAQTSQHQHIPSWAAQLSRDLNAVAQSKREQQCRRVLVGLSVQYVMDNFAGNDQTENHADLSEAMKLRVSLDKALSRYKKANEAIKLHYDRKTGFSAAWKGESATIEQDLTTEKQLEQIQYLNGTLALPIAKVRELGIEPMQSDDWCINADGSEAMKADDYFVGNLQDCLNKIDTDIQAATNDEIRQKLLKMKQLARERATPLNVDNVRFSLRSPFVPPHVLKRFVDYKLSNTNMKADLEQHENGKMTVTINGNYKTEYEKVLRRVGFYLQNGTVSHGGMEIYGSDQKLMPESERLRLIREEITKWNAEFDTWLKADTAFMSEIRAKANDPKNIQFPQMDDESAVVISGAGDDVKLHSYQNAFVRKTAREFAPINAFDVGLGKTFTAMAAAQYALETGTKRKVCFVVPNAVLSNWNKESKKYFKESEREHCLFIGADTDKDGEFTVNSANYARDLNRVLENKHNKIFMTQQAFEKIRIQENSAAEYADYIRSVDKSFEGSKNAKKDEIAESKRENLLANILGKGKLENAPFFEDLGIDALVIDEAHHFKNAKKAIEVAQVRGLPNGDPSNRAVDMAVKGWLIRGGNPRKDGVMALTATPVTNSPLEIYAMLSLSVGEERINQAFLGQIKGADDFIETICEIQSREEMNLVGEVVSVQSLVGIKNLDLVQNLIQSNADVKNAADVGASFKQVDSEDFSDGVQLDDSTKRALAKYKNAYRIARKFLKKHSDPFFGENPQAVQDYHAVLKEVGTNEKVGHPFSMVNRMSKALLDTELLTEQTRYTVQDENAAQKAVDAFNSGALPNGKKGKVPTFKTENKPDDKKLIIKEENRKDEDGNIFTAYTVQAQAVLENGVVVLNCNDFNAQLRLEALLDNEKAGVSVLVSPKVAALVANVKKEQANIRFKLPDGSKPKYAKQIIFVESLAMHTKIKRILAKECGVPASHITFISGQFNSDPDEIIDVQERFNGNDEDGYSIVIANKKAEVGINLQKGCQAIHHLELNWTPDSITQRNGRGIRQGNTAEKVNVYFYEADGTFDSYKRTAINRKSNWIGAVMSKAQAENGYAEVGQGLTEQDYEEMIDFDGSAAQFEMMMKRQDERKQAEINRAAIQAQDVNIGIIKSANLWLKNHETANRALLQEARQAREDNDELMKAKERLQKSIDKGSAEKTIAKNQKDYDLAYAKMEKWLERLGSISFNGYNGKATIIAKISDEQKNGQFSYVYRNKDFDVNASFNEDALIDFDDNHIVAQEWQREHNKQVALRDVAFKNAMRATDIDDAVPDFAVESIFNNETTPLINGQYVRKNTIVRNESNHLFIFTPLKTVFNHDGYTRTTASNEAVGDDLQVWQPESADYEDGLKALAQWQRKFMQGEFEYYKDYGNEEKYPSHYLPDVARFLGDVQIPMYLSRETALPMPYYPFVLPYKYNASALYQSLHEQQKDLLDFNHTKSDGSVLLLPKAKEWGESTNKATIQMGLDFLRGQRLEVGSLNELGLLLQMPEQEIISPLVFPEQYNHLHEAYLAKVKTSQSLNEVIGLYVSFLQELMRDLGLGEYDFATLAFVQAKAKENFHQLSEHAPKQPFALALSGNTFALNQHKFKQTKYAGIRNLAVRLELDDKVAWIDKMGQANKESDKKFLAESQVSGLKNTWLVAPKIWEAIQQEVSASLLSGIDVKEIFAA